MSAVISSLFVHHSRPSPILESATLAIGYFIPSGIPSHDTLAEGWHGTMQSSFRPHFLNEGMLGYAAENLARVFQIALNYLKSETNFKGGIGRKQKKAALGENYLAAILAVGNAECVLLDQFSRFLWQ